MRVSTWKAGFDGDGEAKFNGEAGFDGEMYVVDDHVYLLNGHLNGNQYERYNLPRNAGSGRAVEFITPKLGYLGRLNGPFGLLKTVDGKSFTPIEDLKGAKICGIAHIGKDFVIAVGPYYGGDKTQDKRVNISKNGGRTWEHPNVDGLIAGATDVHCISEDACVIAGKNIQNEGALFYTADGGKNWRQVHEAGTGYGWKLQFLDAHTGFASMWPESIAKTVDGGITWEGITIEQTEGIEGVGFINASLGFVSGKDTLMTTDGGRTWERTSLTGKVDKFFLSDGVLYAKAGYIMRYKAQSTGYDEAKTTSSFLHSEITHAFNQGDLSIFLNLLEPSPVRFLFIDHQGYTVTKQETPLIQGRHKFNVVLADEANKVLVLTDPELYLIELDSQQP